MRDRIVADHDAPTLYKAFDVDNKMRENINHTIRENIRKDSLSKAITGIWNSNLNDKEAALGLMYMVENLIKSGNWEDAEEVGNGRV